MRSEVSRHSALAAMASALDVQALGVRQRAYRKLIRRAMALSWLGCGWARMRRSWVCPSLRLASHHVTIGWSTDRKWIYLEGAGPELLRVPVADGTPERWIGRPPERGLGECRAAADGRQLVCTSSAKADIWMLDDFDRFLPKR